MENLKLFKSPIKRVDYLGHIFISLFIFLGFACKTNYDKQNDTETIQLIDPNATTETRALYANLRKISDEHILFGHQDDLAYGFKWIDEPGRSDVMEVAGSYPAVYGWELGHLEHGAEVNLDNVNFEKMKSWIIEGHQRGGIITISWHMDNIVTGGSTWDIEHDYNVVAEMIPGGDKHDDYKIWLDRFYVFIQDLISIDEQGNDYVIPIIFRPWHEHNGGWFWWGKGNTTEEDFISLWRFTVEYLRDVKGINNLIWAYSSHRMPIDIDNFEQDYNYGYPGDDYVDIIGLDNYWDVGHPKNITPKELQKEYFKRSLRYTVKIAQEKNKIAALTETGRETIPEANWWTEVLLPGLIADDYTRKISYLLVWRNANHEHDRPNHHYAPYPGHVSAEDFVDFRNHPVILFEDDLPDMYRY